MQEIYKINSNIYPRIFTVVIGKPFINEDSVDAQQQIENMKPNIVIDLPRSAYLLYLQKIASEKKEKEVDLLKNIHVAMH